MTAIWRVFFVWSTVLLILLAISAPHIEPGTGTYVVSMVSLAILLVTLVGSTVFIYFDWDPFEEL